MEQEWWRDSALSLLLRGIAYVRPYCLHRRQHFAEDVWSVMVTGHASGWLLSFSDFLTVSLPVLGLNRYRIYCAAAAAVRSWSMIAACSRQRQRNAAFEGNSILVCLIKQKSPWTFVLHYTLLPIQLHQHQTAKGYFRVKFWFKLIKLYSTGGIEPYESESSKSPSVSGRSPDMEKLEYIWLHSFI